jgi:cytochrome P450
MSQMRWLQEQPDHILSQHEVNKQFLCAEYTMLNHKIIGEARLGDFVRRKLTRDLDAHANAVVEEIEHSLETLWGTHTEEWKEIPLYDIMLSIIGRLVNRVLVGLPLCRDPEYLNCSIKFANSVIITAGAINLLPSWLKPIFGPLITAYDTFQYRKLARVIQPIVRERSVSFGPGIALKRKQDTSQPNDFVTWALCDAYSGTDMTERTPEMITKRLAVLGFAAIQSSAITITNALFDIASSPSSVSIQETLRSEALGMATQHLSSPWTRASLAQMSQTDSVLRESLRLWGFVSHGVTKAIVAKDGVTLPSGHHLPYGAKCGIATYGPQHDSSVYNNPYTFDAFRFSRNKESHPTAKEANKESNRVPTAFVTTSDYYMGFSHGRHAWYVPHISPYHFLKYLQY